MPFLAAPGGCGDSLVAEIHLFVHLHLILQAGQNELFSSVFLFPAAVLFHQRAGDSLAAVFRQDTETQQHDVFSLRVVQTDFIEKGITRSYVLHSGKQITTWFSKEGDAACGSWDLYRNKAGFEYVETLEETTAYSVSIGQLNELYRSYIDLANWMRVLQQENFLRLQDIHIRRLNWSSKERYEHLTKECPELFQRVNLGYIASFLGITQQSLSRIRANGRFLT